MEFRNPSELGMPSPPPGYNPSLMRAGSAFSKPAISPPPSLLSPKTGARNGDVFPANSARPPPPSLELGTANAAPPSDHSPGGTASNSKFISKSSPATVAATDHSSGKYRECLRNHAAASGGHVVDGCGEFMPSGEADTVEALTCAACGCHRSFHRRDADGGYYHASPRQLPLLLPPPPLPHHHHHHGHAKQFQFGGFSSPSSAVPVSSGYVHFGASGGGSGGTTTESSSEEMVNAGAPAHSALPRKRFRTKFTPEQKDKMLEFAEKVGWRIQRQDYGMVEQFCAEIGVRRQVLKVWMHNNKSTAAKAKQLQQPPQPLLLLPSPPPEEELLLQQRHQQPPQPQ